MKKKIQIKNRYTEAVIFEFECENNTMAITLIEAVKRKISLTGADFRRANFHGADFREADFRGADFRGADFRRADFYGADFRGADFYGADFREADFYGADFRRANFHGADFYGADFRGADFREADFRGADFYGADFRGANFRGADFREADFYGADFRRANFHGADFREADFRGADFREADFSEVKDLPYIPMACPTDGSFIGWKKVQNYLIKLEIPEDAERSSATTRKCRCSKAKVLSITNINDDSDTLDEIINDVYNPLTYKAGDVVYPDSWDSNRWNECSHGIHFFINKQEAIDY